MNTMLSYNVRGERKNLHVTKGERKEHSLDGLSGERGSVCPGLQGNKWLESPWKRKSYLGLSLGDVQILAFAPNVV
jgi:hypothetical protein